MIDTLLVWALAALNGAEHFHIQFNIGYRGGALSASAPEMGVNSTIWRPGPLPYTPTSENPVAFDLQSSGLGARRLDWSRTFSHSIFK